jgi:hypothetical protein
MLVVNCSAVLLSRNLNVILNARNQQLYSLQTNQTSSSYNSQETDHHLLKNFDLTPVLVYGVLIVYCLNGIYLI